MSRSPHGQPIVVPQYSGHSVIVVARIHYSLILISSCVTVLYILQYLSSFSFHTINSTI